jgi:hypothetical protein
MCRRRQRRPAWTGWSYASSAQALRGRSGGPTPRFSRGSPSWTEASVAEMRPHMRPHSGVATKPGSCGGLAAFAPIIVAGDWNSEALPKCELSARATDTTCLRPKWQAAPSSSLILIDAAHPLLRTGIGLPPVVDRCRVQRPRIAVSGSGKVRFTPMRLRVVGLGCLPPLGGS